jgi:hypothetical protein
MDCYTAGWGDINENGSSTNILQNVKLKVYETNLCNSVLPEIPKDWARQICIHDINGGKGPCFDDGGGAIFVKDTVGNKEKLVVAGLVGYSVGCARSGK